MAMSRSGPTEKTPLLVSNDDAFDKNSRAPKVSHASKSSLSWIKPAVAREAEQRQPLLMDQAEALRDECCFKLGPMWI